MVYSGAVVSTFDDGLLRRLQVTSGAQMNIANAQMEVVSVASNAILRASSADIDGITLENRGAAYISGGIVSNSEVGSRAILQFCSGTTAVDTVVKAGGHCYIGAGATVSGNFTIEAGATIIAFTGGTVNFSIDGRTSDDSALLNNMSAIRGNIAYSISVDSAQSMGKYRLADGVKNFTKAVELDFGGSILEGLSLDNNISGNGVTFDLQLEDNSLYLEMSYQATALESTPDLLAGIDSYSTGLANDAAAADPAAAAQNNEQLKNGFLA